MRFLCSISYRYMKSINHIPSLQSPSFIIPPRNIVPILYSCLLSWCPKGFLNVSPLWVHFTLVRSTPAMTLPYPFNPYPPFSTVFTIHLYILYFHRCYVLQHYWYSIILLSFPSFPKFHRVVPLLQTCSMYEFVYNHTYFCVCLPFESIFHVWEKICGLFFPEPGLLYLAWCLSVASVYIQITCHYSLWLNKSPLYI
jgi:hypothetical protein